MLVLGLRVRNSSTLEIVTFVALFDICDFSVLASWAMLCFLKYYFYEFRLVFVSRLSTNLFIESCCLS